MATNENIFLRADLLLGTSTIQNIHSKKVILFGVGGVGSWCAEALVRTGIEYLTIVDFDNVCETNINRQLMATSQTVGKSKVELLKVRLLEINPDAHITALQEKYTPENYEQFRLDEYDYIIDAIDMMESKTHLIQTATKTDATFFSSMGAALKKDPTKVKVTEFWKVQGCPLAASLRRRMKESGKPAKKFLCAYSDEIIEKRTKMLDENGEKIPNGSLIFVTAAFGLNLASLVIRDIAENG